MGRFFTYPGKYSWIHFIAYLYYTHHVCAIYLVRNNRCDILLVAVAQLFIVCPLYVLYLNLMSPGSLSTLELSAVCDSDDLLQYNCVYSVKIIRFQLYD